MKKNKNQFEFRLTRKDVDKMQKEIYSEMWDEKKKKKINIKKFFVNIKHYIKRQLYDSSKCLSESELHQFWKNPSPDNLPITYSSVKYEYRSKFLLNIIKLHLFDHNSKILELGCNVGRNLNILYSCYKNLSGIDICSKALELGKEKYPVLYQNGKFYNTDIKKQLRDFINQDYKYDLIFSMAVLQHIPNIVINEIVNSIAKLTNLYILIEDEFNESNRHFPRNYKKIFENHGFKQIQDINDLTNVFNRDFVMRVFKKNIKK